MTPDDFALEELVKYLFTDESMGTRPTAWFVALFKPDDNEVAGADDDEYARQAVTFEDYSTVGRRRNDAAVEFAPAGSGADYTVRSWGIYTAASGGQLLFTKRLEFDRSVEEGQAVSFGAGDLVVGVT